MKCKKDNIELVCYHSSDYPFDSGMKCPVCRREWSQLQLARSQWWCSEDVKARYSADGIIWENEQ